MDEIGKMELFSKKFEQCVEMAFKKRNIRILATVPVRGPPFVAALKRGNGSQLFTVQLFAFYLNSCILMGSLLQVTRENRDLLVNEISRLLISRS